MKARFRVSRRSMSALASNFSALSKASTKRIQRRVKVRGEEMKQLAKELAPRDTGNLQDSVIAEYSPEGLAVTVTHDLSFFDKTGKDYTYPGGETVDYYGGIQELSTGPHLSPAFHAIAPKLSRDVGDELRAEFRKRRSRRT